MKTYLMILLSLLSLLGQAERKSSLTSPGTPEGNQVVINGTIKDKNTGEELIGAAIYFTELQTGAITDITGWYTLSLKAGSYNVKISYVGYESQEQRIVINQSATINYELIKTTTSLKEVVVSDFSKANANTSANEMSVVSIKMEQIKSIPALMGETDVVKVIQLLPGVQSSGEGFSGFSVRGGGTEQNMILLDDANVYNASHMMGFFSVFNNDAIKDMKLYKGDLPASKGGRLSSVLDIQTKEGNLKKITGCAGIGTISSRAEIEGPVVRDKCSFMVSARRSYADLFLKMSKDSAVNQNGLYFYDLNYKLTYKLDNRNKIFISGYKGLDAYHYADAFGMKWGNTTQTLKWNHIFNNKSFVNTSLMHSSYKYRMTLSKDILGFIWDSQTSDYSAKADFTIYPDKNNTLRFGIMSTVHHFNPGIISPNGNEAINHYAMEANNALESIVYLDNEKNLGSQISLDYGVRFTLFQNIGKATVYHFGSDHQSFDSTVYLKNKIYHSYAGIEPRLGIKYEIDGSSSVKAGYSRTRQYIQLASNSQGGTPFDMWFPSDPNIEPQLADQVAAGYFRNFKDNTIETSVELYYKTMQNQIDFKDNAMLLMNPKLDGEIRTGNARAYGIEFFVRKQTGSLTGWVSYTLSKSERKIDDINQGNYYSSNCDKPNNISVVLSYALSGRLSLSASWVYTSGAPVTLPAGKYIYGNAIVPVYSGRNGSRLPDYHRMDISATLKGKDKPGKKIKGEWNFSVYNVYNRKNTFSVSFEQSKDSPSQTEAYKVYLFPVIPAISYNVKF